MTTAPHAILAKIEARFHDLIRERAGDLLAGPEIALPRLDGQRGTADDRCWFPVRGMYGGFSYWIVGEESHVKLIVESWSRIADGWGQRHEITADSTRLVEDQII